MELRDIEDLKEAKELFERPGMAVKISNMLGVPIEKGLERLPHRLGSKIAELTRAALVRAVEVAVATMNHGRSGEAKNRLHKIAVAATGGVGGFFGLAALSAELPVSTTLMLRSIADIARSQGEDVRSDETKLACLEVFALGGSSRMQGGAESGYFAIRAGLARSLSKVTEHAVQRSFSREGAPVLMRLIGVIADRFSVQVTEKAAAQALPALGAAGGALINTIFIKHFQDVARGHFIIRRLERRYGKEEVRREYENL